MQKYLPIISDYYLDRVHANTVLQILANAETSLLRVEGGQPGRHMFFDGGSGKKAVDLRGKSKKEDRQVRRLLARFPMAYPSQRRALCWQMLIARAERAREEREKQRQRLRAALFLQSSIRARLDLRRVAADERTRFDAGCHDEERQRAAISDAGTFVALTRSLLFFHSDAEPSDAERRRRLLQMMLQAAGSVDLSTNACAQLCGTVAGAATWQHQSRRLIELSLPHLADGAASLEIRCALYLTDPSGWRWASLLSAERAAALPQLARTTLLQLARKGLHAAVVRAVRPTLGAGAQLEGDTAQLAARLLGLSMRHALHACLPPPPGERTFFPPPAWHFAREVLGTSGLVGELPPALVASCFAPILQPLVRTLALDVARLTLLLPPGPLGAASLVGNLVQLVAVCGAQPATAGAAAALGDALPSYISLLHACLPWFPSLAGGRRSAASRPSPPPGGSAPCSDSESEPMDTSEAGGPEATRPAEPGAAEAIASRDRAAAQIRLLLAPDHIGLIWQAALAPSAAPPLVHAVPQLASVFCELLFGGEGAGGQPRQSQLQGMMGLHLLHFRDNVPRLWELAAAVREGWGTAEGGSLLTVFCSAFSQARRLRRLSAHRRQRHPCA